MRLLNAAQMCYEGMIMSELYYYSTKVSTSTPQPHFISTFGARKIHSFHLDL